jgi:hypothetical protein
MCLYISKPRGIKRRFAYKVLEKDLCEYITPYRDTPIELGQIFRSNRRKKELTKTEIKTGEVHKGVHVFTSLDEAQAIAWVSNRRILVVKVDPNDWVADGREGDAVYTKIFVTDKFVKKC